MMVQFLSTLKKIVRHFIFRMVTSCNSDAEFLAATSDKNMIYLGWF